MHLNCTIGGGVVRGGKVLRGVEEAGGRATPLPPHHANNHEMYSPPTPSRKAWTLTFKL